ncbi:MAG: D-2-hydroxyacid dehydrogenase [Capnocytophaga sp.]|nr:D-2-hydroxyacid dehydrogenase [Capnocytophaga sp.]
MKILANDGISAQAEQTLRNAGFEVQNIKVAQNQLSNYINEQQIEILLVRSATKVFRDVIEACPSLKLIGRGGVGLDNIDVQFAENKGIKVINTPNASSLSVAELVFAHLLGAVRFLYDANRNMPLEGDTNFNGLKSAYSNGQELKGKTLGIIGFGRIGTAVAKIAISLGMRVLAYDPFVDKATITLDFYDGQKVEFPIETITKEEVLKNSDFITLHLPSQKEPIITADEYSLMKKGAGIINLARGGALNETILLENLDNEQLAFACLDVYENEPTPSMHVLMHPKISHSPHIGAVTKEAQNRVGEELALQIIQFFKK